MAIDIKIDYEKDDLAFEDGDLVVTDGSDCIKQQIKTGLYILPLDWFIDLRWGINYFKGFREEPKKLQAQIKDAIRSVDGVVRLGKYTFDNSTTKWKVNAIVYTFDNDEIEINAETPIGEY